MLKPAIIAAALAGASTFAAFAVIPALAQDAGSPIEMRQKLMKQNGKDAKAAGKMLKGEADFDPAEAQTIFSEMHDVSMKFGDYFPDDSKTGHKTEAAPAIWEKPDEFKAALMKFQSDTETAMSANVETLDAFKAQFGMVAKNCKGCHEDFRIKDEN